MLVSEFAKDLHDKDQVCHVFLHFVNEELAECRNIYKFRSVYVKWEFGLKFIKLIASLNVAIQK